MYRQTTFRELGILLLLSAVLAGTTTNLCAQTTSGSVITDGSLFVLEPGRVNEREISGTQSHKYQILLPAGQFATVAAKETGIDLTLRLRTADGKIIAVVDSHNSPDATESISIVADAATTFELEVSSDMRKAGPSGYSITLSEPRPATADDKTLFEALQQVHEAVRILRAGNQTDKALELAKFSLQSRERILGKEDSLVADALIALGRAAASKGDPILADASFERALNILEKRTGKESVQYANGLLGLGRAKFARGEMKAAETLMLQTLAILEKTRDAGGLRGAIVLSNLGLLYRTSTDFRQGELTYRKALSIAQKTVGDDHIETANILNNLGLMYNAAGDYTNAQKELERSLAIVEQLTGSETRDFAIGLNNLGLVSWRKGDYDKAEATWKRALSIFERVNGPESDGVANVLGNLGIIYKEHYQDYAKAEASYKRALTIIQKLSGEYSLLAGTALASLSLAYRSMGDLAQAETYSLRALDVYEKSVGPSHQNVVLVLATLAQLSAMKGDLAASLAYQRRIEAIDSQAMQANMIIGSERQKIAFFSRLRSTDRSISFLVNFAPDNPEVRDLVATQILQRKGRILDALAHNLFEIKKRVGPDDEKLLARLNEVTSEISKLTSEGRKKREQSEYEASVRALLQERDTVEADISRRTAGSYVPTKPVELSAIRAAIPEESALIEFAVYRPFEWNYNETKEPYGDPRYIAFVIRNKGDIRWHDLGDTKSVDDSIGKLRSALRDPGRADVERLAQVVQKILAPVRTSAGNAHHLIISPDGELNLLPFEALMDEQRKYLAERYSFTYLTSGRDLLRPERPEGRQDLLVVSNPSFGDPPESPAPSDNRAPRPAVREKRIITRSLSDTYFAPLAGTAREASAIKTIYPDAKIVTGLEATETAFKQVSAPGILHIATHGFFLNSNAPESQTAGTKLTETLSENPLLRSGLAFAGANRRSGGNDDGILTALEASGLNLRGTKLVVLSACDTGVGEIRNGEGVYGLRRSFVLAGAESLVMSLWPVSDQVTRELMTGYYQNLKKGLGRGEALREVRLQMIRQPSRRHPFYWASFIQSGEWANLDGKR